MPTLQLWPLDQYPQHYLKCQAASASGDSFLDEQPPTNEECDLRLRGVPRPPPPPKVYYPSQVSSLFGAIFVQLPLFHYAFFCNGTANWYSNGAGASRA